MLKNSCYSDVLILCETEYCSSRELKKKNNDYRHRMGAAGLSPHELREPAKDLTSLSLHYLQYTQ